MKLWLAASAMFGICACLENPGVDHGLATRHDRLEDDFLVDSYARLHLKIERMGDVSRLTITNPGPRMIDSLEFFLQVLGSPLLSRYEIPDMVNVPISGMPMAQFHGKVVGLASGETFDLGPVDLFYPWGDLDRFILNFIPFKGSIAGRPIGRDGMGYFTGRIYSVDTALHFPGGSFQGVATDYQFFSWLGENELGSLTGGVFNDSLAGLTYLHYWNARGANPIDLGKLAEGDSVSFQAAFYDRQVPPESTLMSVTLVRPRVPRFREFTQ